MSVVAPEVEAALRPRARAYLRDNGTLGRPWAAVLDDLGRVHADIVADLARAPDGFPTAVRARVVVVMNAAATDGVTVPLAWEDEIDWKAYAVFLRLHAIDHLNQARKVLAALAGC